MSLTLNLPPEAEAELQLRAERAGKSIEEFVLFMAGIVAREKEELRRKSVRLLSRHGHVLIGIRRLFPITPSAVNRFTKAVSAR